MATGKEIRGKIKNFDNTKKITKAMEMISVSKMRKAQAVSYTHLDVYKRQGHHQTTAQTVT